MSKKDIIVSYFNRHPNKYITGESVVRGVKSEDGIDLPTSTVQTTMGRLVKSNPLEYESSRRFGYIYRPVEEKKEEKLSIKNQEHYNDPTAFQALKNVEKKSPDLPAFDESEIVKDSVWFVEEKNGTRAPYFVLCAEGRWASCVKLLFSSSACTAKVGDDIWIAPSKVRPVPKNSFAFKSEALYSVELADNIYRVVGETLGCVVVETVEVTSEPKVVEKIVEVPAKANEDLEFEYLLLKQKADIYERVLTAAGLLLQ